MKLSIHQKAIIGSQCAGQIGLTIFTSGVLLSYSQFLGFSSSVILILLNLPELMGALMIVPAAYYTNRIGIKVLGAFGIVLITIGFIILMLASFTDSNRMLIAFTGIGLVGLGWSMFNCGWLPLIGAQVNKNERGRFLGTLRFTWQLVSIFFSFIALSLIHNITELSFAYTLILSAVIGLQMLRLYLYQKIPDHSEKETGGSSLAVEVFALIKTSSFMSYCCYIFFLTLYTAACPLVINLAEKDFLGFTQPQIIFVNTLLLIGNLFGFYLGGIITDRYGTKPVFILAHFLFGLILLLFVGRDILFVPYIYSHCVLMLLFGLVSASSSIAITTELFEVIPFQKALLATSFFSVVVSLSKFLGAYVSSQALHLNLFTQKWSLGSFQMNCYDTILLGSAGMVVLLVMTLGLIPSVQKEIHQKN